MGMSADAPWTDMSYKLVEYDHRPVLKLSTGKASWPGRKQIFRFRDGAGNFGRDVIGLRDEELSGKKLLREYLRDGRLLDRYPSLMESRNIIAEDFAALPLNVKEIRSPAPYPVEFSAKLDELRVQTAKNLR
jgi:nicotinate phosphoribosyltransferase